jgi:ABC-type dipeptide/oligopeptide/nickel transport system permease subunit
VSGEALGEAIPAATLSESTPEIGSVWRQIPKAPVVLLGIIILMALFAPVLTAHDPERGDLASALVPPVGFQAEVGSGFSREVVSGTWTHPLGTDSVGRDILTRVLYGARYTLSVVLIAMIIGAIVGTIVGMVSGYFGGYVDLVLNRLVDVFFSIPVILLALMLVVVRGPGFGNVVIAMSFVLWTRFARVIRGETIALKSREFVAQARVNGVRPSGIMLRHILPNTVPTLTVLVSLQLGQAILIEASLSFLGAGLPPTLPSWGVMIDSGQRVLREAWWVAAVPGVAIMVVVLIFNTLGDWLRDVLDPHLSHQL